MDELISMDDDLIWHPYTPLQGGPSPILIDSADGVYLRTKDGRDLIDAVSSWWVNLHGHANQHIQQAIAKQAASLEHVIFAGFTHEPAIRLAQNLLKILPSNQRKIFYSDNGSTAVEVAIKMAIQYWYNLGKRRNKIIALQGAYHGDTFGAMAVGERGLFTVPFQDYLFEVTNIDFPDGVNDQHVIDQFKGLVNRDAFAAFVYEPLVQGASGMRIYASETLDALLKIAHEHDILCIADEVFTGFGRTGKMFASDYLADTPDIVAMSKGITGGFLPLGATSCSGKVTRAFETPESSKTFFHGHSYTANPIACAAANASFELLCGPDCQRQIGMIAEMHKAFVGRCMDHPAVRDARSMGTIMALELASGERTSYTNALRKTIYEYFLARNVLLRPLGNTLYVLPPYIITENQLQHVHDIIAEFLATLPATS
jgi:adenosylmethionine-8-amino-7-oxononanoate aminotransferase